MQHVLDHFKLINFTIIEGVPGRRGIFRWWSNKRFTYACPL